MKLHQRLLRSSKSLWFDEHLSYTLCELILTSCQESKDFETGVEYGSRLAYRVDIVTMEAHTDVVKFKESWNRDFKHLDVAHHFENMLTLSTVAKNAEEYSTVALALKQAIDMFMVERLIGQEGKIATKIKSGMSSTFLSFPLEWGKEKIIMELCLALVVANELGMGNPELSFKYAQKSLEQFHLMRNDKEEVDEEKESSLHFLVGRMTYGYLLSLAGGKRIASSPPIPVLAPGSKKNLPNIKDLLEESLAYLEKAFDSAPDDDMNPSGKDGIAMQVKA